MFDLGWTELLVIGVVALIVVGPKDLPVLFRNVGRFVGKARGMANEFSRAMHQAADESGVNDMAKGLKTATNPVGSAMDGVKEAAKDIASTFDPKEFSADLSDERAEDARKIQQATAEAATARKEADAGAAAPEKKADT
ncbi:Sec-independent protein translocase protein TatB [Epibacterium ulvae]|uniref:Sec-independent protein translocase protein TatB n=1 Tax=Epibacterium ulvae TaxID=1156985 RepID=A0A1G5QNU5_9RHOB|nr:Sec-independent protein translocase protein TatB [Epibacterium ulvae]SCZ63407.1 sec-independent protein translocase protein TatB [Epibacterium ulvae]